MKSKAILGMALALMLATGATASDLWVHVKVDDGDEKVRVNIPLSLVENLLPLINVDPLRHGKLRIDGFDLDEFDDIDVRELFRSIRNLDDAEFVSVQGDDHEQIRVYKEGSFIMITFEDSGDERGFVRIPLDVVGALFSGESNELDLLAALEELGRHADGDLVQIQDGDTSVRIWIDNQNVSD